MSISKFGKLWLSPMESVSDLGFRKLCYDNGASLTFIQMLYADAILRNNKATIEHIDSYDPKIPTGIQLLVSNPKILSKTLDLIKKNINENNLRFSNISVIDLNFGCPSPVVINSGNGPAIFRRTERMKELLNILKKNSPVPCGIKIRLGLNKYDKDHKVYLRVIEIANSIGLDYVTVHSKLAIDSSKDEIDFKALQEITDHATVHIIGNGFVVDGESAKKFFDLGCSAVMIARAAIWNPWIFNEINDYLNSGKISKIKKDYAKAWHDYENIANKYGTKKKFYDYHKKIFTLRSKGDLGYHAPSRILNE